jgi:hypothetical protein
MGPSVLKLMPPILANDLAGVDLIARPGVLVLLLIQKDGLSDFKSRQKKRTERTWKTCLSKGKS